MKTQRVFSRNAAYQRFEVLKTNRQKRYANGAFFVEGVRNLNEAVAAGFAVESWLYAEGRPLSRWAQGLLDTVPTRVNYVLAPELLDDLSGKTDASELLAVVAMRQDTLDTNRLGANPLLLLLDRPSNKGNLGTILRTCDALGVDAVLLTGHGVDLYDPDVISASMGSFFRVPAIRVASHADILAAIGRIRAQSPALSVVGTTAHQAEPIHSVHLAGPTLLCIGNETDGLSRALKEACDRMATIPMREGSGASSLNVACAATVMVYEALMQRQKAPGNA